MMMFVFLASSGLAQENNKRKIDAVKRDGGYLYGDATLQTERNAVKLACDLLKDELKKWSNDHNISDQQFSETVLTHYADTILVEKRNHVRAFVYVKASRLSSLISNNQTPKSGTPVVVTPPPAPVRESVTPTPAREPVAPAQVQTPVKRTNPVLERLMSVSSFYDLKNVIAPLHNQGVIQSYGKYSTMKDPAECYLIVYDANGSIKAILGKGKDTRENLKTHQPDNVRNYSGCGAIWFKLAE